MPSAEYRNKEVRLAIISALQQRGLSYSDVASLLGIKYNSVKDFISIGNFSPRRAAKWSAILGIPIEVFTEGAMVEDIKPYGKSLLDLQTELNKTKDELNELRNVVEDLLQWKAIICNSD